MSASDPFSSGVARNGDVLTQLDGRFRRPLNSYFRRRTSDATEAEDLTQEVFLRIARRRDQMTLENLEAFVFTIAANLMRDRGRRRAVRGIQVALPFDHVSETLDRGLVEVLDPDRVLAGKDDLDRVMAALAELPERTQDIFVLQRIEGMKNREIAEWLGISVSAIEKHMARALAHLARSLPPR